MILHVPSDGIEKTPTEYAVHLDGDIFAVVNVFKTYRFVHIRHTETRHIHWMVYVITQPFWRSCKIIGEKREGNPSTWKYFGETIKKVTIERKDKRTSITLKNVALDNLLKW